MTGTLEASTDLALRPSQELGMPAMDVNRAIERRNALVGFVQKIMVKGVDYGSVPGTDKDTLMKPGAEKLVTFFGLTVHYKIIEKVEDWTGERHGGEPFFYYLYRCRMFRSGTLIAESDGSCNSRESKYRWRWVAEHDVSPQLDRSRLTRRTGRVREPAFAIERRDTAGKYGKPDAYWDRFEAAIQDGDAQRVEIPAKNGKTMVGWEIVDSQYRVPNEDVAGLVNTIQKMAQKRALVGTTLLSVNASEFFTQDVEDMDMIDSVAAPSRRAAPAPQEEPEYQVTADGEPDLTHNPTFIAEWGRRLTARKLTAKAGHQFLERAMASEKHANASRAVPWRQAWLGRLERGEFDDAIKGKKSGAQKEDAAATPQPQAASQPATAQQQQPADSPPAAQPEKSTQQQPQASDAAAPVDQATDAEVETWDAFYANAREAIFGEVADADFNNGIKLALKGVQKTPQTVSKEMRKKWLRSIRDGSFNWLSGRIEQVQEQQTAAT